MYKIRQIAEAAMKLPAYNAAEYAEYGIKFVINEEGDAEYSIRGKKLDVMMANGIVDYYRENPMEWKYKNGEF